MLARVKNWEEPSSPEEQRFSANEVIRAYKTGMSDGMEKSEMLFKQKLFDNSDRAASDTNKVIEELTSRGITAISAHLRIISVYEFEVLITVSNEDFIKDSFEDIYTFVNSIEKINRTELYSVTFSFINQSSEFDKDLLKADGYRYNYKK